MLIRVLLLNLVVAIAKIAFGYASGAISILSDGFHSLTDAGSNVVGLVGVRAARRPPDEDHPYGHRKYETVAAAGVTAGLLLVMLEILRNAFNHLTGRSAPPDISTAGFLIMCVRTVLVDTTSSAAISLAVRLLGRYLTTRSSAALSSSCNGAAARGAARPASCQGSSRSASRVR